MTSRDSLPNAAKGRSSDHVQLPGLVVLVLQGGGAQGCDQAGAYEALHEAGIEPDWVIGTSIGALNGAIIAGNRVVHRLERLREFWAHFETRLPEPWSQLKALLGVRGFYHLNPAVAWGVEPKSASSGPACIASIRSRSCCRTSLISTSSIAESRGSRSGSSVCEAARCAISTAKQRRSVLSTCWVRAPFRLRFPRSGSQENPIGMGAFTRSTPVEAVFADEPRMSSVVFAAQIWHARGPEPESIAQAYMREKDILFGSRSRNHIARQAQIHRMRHAVRELVNMLRRMQACA